MKNVKNLTIAELRSLLTDSEKMCDLLRQAIQEKTKFSGPTNKATHNVMHTRNQIPYLTDPLYKMARRHRDERRGDE